MKKSLLLLSAFVAGSLVFSSCDKNSGDPSPSNDQTQADPTSIVKNVKIAKITDEDGSEMLFSYDGEGNLKTVSESWESSDEHNGYSYSFTGTGTFNLVYANGTLSKINYSGEGSETTTDPEGQVDVYEWDDNGSMEYSYNSKNLVEKITYTWVEEGEEPESEYVVFEYDSNNKIVKQTEFEDGVADDDYATYEWAGDNISKVKYLYTEDSNARKIRNKNIRQNRIKFASKIQARSANAVLEGETVFSDYDDKINPFAIIAVIYGEFDGEYMSKNNWGKSVYKDMDSEGNVTWSEEETVAYDYDNKGRVVKATFTEKYGNNTETESLTIQYKD